MRCLMVVALLSISANSLAAANCSRADLRTAVDACLAAPRAVVGFAQFGPNTLPDTHLFRLENGRIRHVHTRTVCAPTGCASN